MIDETLTGTHRRPVPRENRLVERPPRPVSSTLMSPELIGWIASGVFLARLLPQPIRLFRTGVPDGVSPLSAMNSQIANLGWFLYGIGVASVPIWLVAAVASVPTAWQVLLLRRRITSRDLFGAGLWLAIILTTWLTGSLAFILAGTVIVCQGPQVWTAVTNRNLTGIAVTTWWIAIADATTWGAYGIARGDFALIGYGVVLLACAVTILGRVYWVRRSSSAPALPLVTATATAVA